MNREDSHKIYLFALKDIWALLSDASKDIRRFLDHDGATSMLLRHIYGSALSSFDMSTDFRRIVQGLHRASEQFPESHWAGAMQARALVALGFYEAAIREFEASARLAPECALIAIICGEAYYYLAGREETEDSLDRYMTAVCYLSDAIMSDADNPRPYLCRAHCQAHVIKLCKYHSDSGRFKIYYNKIQKDLMQAKRNSSLLSLSAIDIVSKEIADMLGIPLTQSITDS